MAKKGAPTGKWETMPPHLQDDRKIDIRDAEPKFIVRRPGVPEVEIPIEKTEFVIGRLGSEVDLVLEDERVSRKHAKLSMNDKGYFLLEDLGSQNGIRFQDRVVRRLNLVDGDEFHIGETHFVFRANLNRLRS